MARLVLWLIEFPSKKTKPMYVIHATIGEEHFRIMFIPIRLENIGKPEVVLFPSTAKNSVISPNLLGWNSCGKAKPCENCAYPHNFETRKLGKIKYFSQWRTAWEVSVFGVILVRIFPHSDWIRENADQNNSEYGHFSRGEGSSKWNISLK